ncbi:MAG: acyl-CoA dehydratase activase-related protein, partial [Candidatus Krumholzibacteriales bacterium]
VSTNLALIDEEGTVIKDVYLRTRARPIEVVSEGLDEIRRDVGEYVDIRGVGTTGSGRELIGILIGADIIKDEITAHKSGASFIGDLLLGRSVDTIFEIGGQDSKFISIDDGVVVDFTMNEACAAGTGSFLEEQAEKLDIQIKDEFARRAFQSESPLKMGERCTVYMEQDVTTYMKRGAGKNDIIAGLAYSVVQNYLNRVVRGRKIGDTIFFQGGTAYNDSVAAAFSEVLGRDIIVPPYNGVMGAIGAALLAREKVLALDKETEFRGYDISSIDYSLREFECRGCTNYCSIQEFTVEGEKTYWGDKCSDRYRKRAKVARKAAIPDMISIYKELLDRDPVEQVRERAGMDIDTSWEGNGDAPRAGLPRSMYYYDRGQFWTAYLRGLGFEVVKSTETTKKISQTGMELVVAEPCFPIQIAHGHAAALLEEDTDFIFMPNVLNSETDAPEVNSYVCPWGSTLPYVLQNNPLFSDRRDIIASPSIHFREGMDFVEKQLWGFAGPFGISRKRHRQAVAAAYSAHSLFEEDLLEAGREALEILSDQNETGIVLVGRPYNIMDSEANIGVPAKLRDYYGINVIPYFFLPLEGIEISDVTDNMFWNYGRKIIQANRFVDGRDNLHLIYITNFKCGPDSYIKSFLEMSAKRPFLTLQFDSHGNDAGIMTRCEAYLDSKGVLRWWAKDRSKEEQYTFQECPTEERRPSQRHSDMSA